MYNEISKMFRKLSVRLGLLPSQKESKFVTTIKDALESTTAEYEAFDFDPSLRALEYTVWMMKSQMGLSTRKSVAEQAIELLRGSRLTESEADSIIDLVKTATCNNT